MPKANCTFLLAVMDDTMNTAQFTIMFFLADNTVEICEQYLLNSGDNFSIFDLCLFATWKVTKLKLSKPAVFRTDCQADDLWNVKDLYVGAKFNLVDTKFSFTMQKSSHASGLSAQKVTILVGTSLLDQLVPVKQDVEKSKEDNVMSEMKLFKSRVEAELFDREVELTGKKSMILCLKFQRSLVSKFQLKIIGKRQIYI